MHTLSTSRKLSTLYTAKDFADDIVLVSSKYEHIQNKTNRLVDNTGRVGLKLNVQKHKVMRMNTRREDKV